MKVGKQEESALNEQQHDIVSEYFGLYIADFLNELKSSDPKTACIVITSCTVSPPSEFGSLVSALYPGAVFERTREKLTEINQIIHGQVPNNSSLYIYSSRSDVCNPPKTASEIDALKALLGKTIEDKIDTWVMENLQHTLGQIIKENPSKAAEHTAGFSSPR